MGATACPAGEFCDVLKGCVKGEACGSTAECQMKLGGDMCKTNLQCVSSICTYQTLDKDMDGHPPVACGGDDCNDDDPSVYPGAPEICDGKDNNCDQQIDDGATCMGVLVCQAGACVCPAANQCGADCADLSMDHANCGKCFHACGATEVCAMGMCQCPNAQADCSGTCVDLNSDPNNCKVCGMKCPAGATCSNGMCMCGPGLQQCGSTCVNILTDPNNCGGCNSPCAGACQNGSCKSCPTADLYILQDLSGSMADMANGGTRLDVCRNAIESFMAEAASAGLGLGIGYMAIPLVVGACVMDADCGPNGICLGGTCLGGGGDSCNVADYAKPAVAVSPLPGISATITSSLAGKTASTNSTPPPALNGALTYAKSFATLNPTHKIAVVLIADGMPNECTANMGVATDLVAIASSFAVGVPKVTTYVIGVSADVPQATWDQIAAAGGTGTAHVANSALDVQIALDAIRTSATACQ
jgi:hypothetical protein